MTLLNSLGGVWHFQRITLECLCSLSIFGRSAFREGDTWHCLNHKLTDVRIVTVAPATLREREELTRDGND
jgi:hypothetical protein